MWDLVIGGSLMVLGLLMWWLSHELRRRKAAKQARRIALIEHMAREAQREFEQVHKLRASKREHSARPPSQRPGHTLGPDGTTLAQPWDLPYTSSVSHDTTTRDESPSYQGGGGGFSGAGASGSWADDSSPSSSGDSGSCDSGSSSSDSGSCDSGSSSDSGSCGGGE